jgi:hypothetical protein
MGDQPYQVDVTIAPPAPQHRWVTGFRIILAIPALIVYDILGYLIFVVAIISWFAILFTGSIPLGLRNLSAWVIRFGAQTNGYVMLLTDRYPDFSTNPTD